MKFHPKYGKYADEVKCKTAQKNSTNYRYEVYSDNTIKILELIYGGLKDEVEGIKFVSGYIEAVIPDNFDGIKVTSIGEGAFAYFNNLTSVIIPQGVISICDRAFLDCLELTEVIIPDSILYIGNEAFAGCDLRKIVIHNNVSIGNNAFLGCNNLTLTIRYQNEIVKSIFELIYLAEQHRQNYNLIEYEECVLEAVNISRKFYKGVTDDLERAYIEALNKASNCYINFGDDDIDKNKCLEDYNKSIEFLNEALKLVKDKNKVYPGFSKNIKKALASVDERINTL